jgi:polysaccharide export outer membrane protein
MRKRTEVSLNSDYPIGPGDVLEISVAGLEEIKLISERVTGEGTISLPLVGVVKAAGMTDKFLREEIRRRLAENYVRDPQVSLLVKEFRSRQVAVIGAVNKPGLYNLSSSADTLLGAISQAGGMRPEAAERILFIPAEAADPDEAKQVAAALPAQLVRQDPAPMILKNADPIVISLDSVTRNGTEQYLHIPARPGDIIMVPGAGEVLVQGWDKTPGSNKITSGLTVLSAVVSARGAMYPPDTGAIEFILSDREGQKASFIAALDAIKSGRQPDLPVREGGFARTGNSFSDVLFAAVTTPLKGVHYLIEAYTLLAHEFSHIRLVIIGRR